MGPRTPPPSQCWQASGSQFHEFSGSGGGGQSPGDVLAGRIRRPSVGPSPADHHILPMIGSDSLGCLIKTPGDGQNLPPPGRSGAILRRILTRRTHFWIEFHVSPGSHDLIGP